MAKEMKHQCCEQIRENTVCPRYHQCSRAGVIERDGNWYCKQHDPIAVKAKQEQRNADWQAKWDKDRKQAENAMRVQMNYRNMLIMCRRVHDAIEGLGLHSEAVDKALQDLRMEIANAEAGEPNPVSKEA